MITAFIIAAAVATAAPTASPTPMPPTAAETAFVQSVTKDLTFRFPTTAAAAAAGYVRYTDEDDTGAINWVNPQYWKSDMTHPSQLWYDVKGRLIGADFSVPKSLSPDKPSMWGVLPARWVNFNPHVHFGVKAGEKIKFDAIGPKGLAKVKSTVETATAADLVKAGKAQSVDQIAFVARFPAMWDLIVWVVPNPAGPFEDANPLVKPSHSPKQEM